MQPRTSRARTPADPPLAAWKESRQVRKRFARSLPAAPLPPAPTPRAIALPPELRPPGEDAIPPPPKIADVAPSLAARLQEIMANEPEPMPGIIPGTIPTGFDDPPVAPVEHVAPMPDAVVERILGGETIGYEEIKAAKEDDNANNPTDTSDTSSGEVRPEAGASSPERPDPPALAEKKAAFFAGFTVPEAAPAEDAAPFVAPGLTETIAKVDKDDPFWK